MKKRTATEPLPAGEAKAKAVKFLSHDEHEHGVPPEGLGDPHGPVVVSHRPTKGKPVTLEYFCLQGLGELPRLLLEATKTNYDSILHFNSKGFKQHAPYGQVPLYRGPELGKGIVLAESGAIVRHIARLTKTQGKNLKDQARVDELIELAKDLMSNKSALSNATSPDSEKLKTFLSGAEAATPSRGKHFVGKGLTVADVAIFHVLQHFIELGPGLFDAETYPKLYKFHASFSAIPQINDYLQSNRRVPLTEKECGKGSAYKYIKTLRPTVLSVPYVA
jgi:glutathione S-transferase